ncbi:MAG: hypothetical protein U9Q82_10535, partial [Chloroflexota bacterium]|nr:hypothetical protein [Chloroflexota bacterium]
IVIEKEPKNGRRRSRIGIGFVVIGFLVFLLGIEPEIFALDRSPVVGFVQISVFLIGLVIICIGGYISFSVQWASRERTISADIGLRLIATGYIIAIVSGMADVFGFGTQPLPGVPYFGPLQSSGVVFGEAVIAIGFLLMMPPQVSK